MAEAALGPMVDTKRYTGWEEIGSDQVFTRELKAGESPKWDDRAAASMIVQDYNRARSALENDGWMLQIEDNDILYQSPRLPSDDPNRARVSRFTVNNQANTMADACRDGLFSQKPPFLLRPRGETTQKHVDAWTALLDVLLDRMKFRYWVGLGVDSQTLHGTGIWKCGWSSRTRIVMKRVPKAAPEQLAMPAGTQKVNTIASDSYDLKPETITESYPWLENRMIGTTVFDPGWRTPNAPELCGFVVDNDYPTWEDLEIVRKDPNYDIPDSETLKAHCFATTSESAAQGTSIEQNLSREGSPVLHADNRNRSTTINPLQQPMQMLERWDGSQCKAALIINGWVVVIRNNEHHLGRIPHFTANWRNILNTGWGMGMGKLVGGDQRLEQGTLNHALNLLAYMFNPVILHGLGANAPTQNRTVRAGGFWGVQTEPGGDVKKAMAVMDMPQVPPMAWEFIQYAKSSSEETSGADQTFMQGNLQGKGSSAARTATGAGRIAAKADGRVQTPVENLELGLFIPYLTMLIDMVKMYMPTEEIRQILKGKLAAEIMQDFDAGKFLEADLEVEMLAASKMASKNAMAQQLPLLMQVLQTPQLLEQLHAEGKTIDISVLLDILFQVSEFRIEDEIIRDMTDKEQQVVQQMHAPNTKVQEVAVQEQMRGQNAQTLEQQKSQHELLHTLIEHVLAQQGGATGEGGKSALERATGLLERKNDETALSGAGPSALAGGDQ